MQSEEALMKWKMERSIQTSELFDASGKRKFDKRVLYGDEIGGLGMFFESPAKNNWGDGFAGTSAEVCQ